MSKDHNITARLAALQTTPTAELKSKWRELFDSAPRPSTGVTWKPDLPTGSRNWPMAASNRTLSVGWNVLAKSSMGEIAGKAASVRI